MKSRVLIVDDEENIRRIFGDILEHAGYDVALAQDYDQALEVVEEDGLDLILTDIMLGSKSGVDLLRTLKDHQVRCPVVMITGYPNLDTAEEAVRLGAFDYVRKPVTAERLVAVARRATEHKQQMDAQERHESTREAILRSVTESIVAVDAQCRLLEVSGDTAFCGFPTEAAGRPLASLANGCGGRCVGVVKRAMETGQPVERVRFECGNEERPHRAVSVSAYPLVRDDGPPGGVMLIRSAPAAPGAAGCVVQSGGLCSMVGKSAPMLRVYALIEALANVQTTVLITGESGTGKELVAQALHECGSRAHGPLVKVNCAALSEGLLESELFGHVRGAFTGAIRDKVGRFQKADGGTIFLDEIGDISPHIQVRLLRVLQEREFERVGDSASIRADVRVVVATNSSLMEKVKDGSFREDLYYRLKVVEIAMPALRDRRDDIPLLTDHFIGKFNLRFGKEISGVTQEVKDLFMRYRWPGNVRELEHRLEHAFVSCKGTVITVEDLPRDQGPEGMEAKGLRGEGPGEREEILGALEKAYWNKTKAAGMLGISRRTIYRKIKEYNLVRE